MAKHFAVTDNRVKFVECVEAPFEIKFDLPTTPDDVLARGCIRADDPRLRPQIVLTDFVSEEESDG